MTNTVLIILKILLSKSHAGPNPQSSSPLTKVRHFYNKAFHSAPNSELCTVNIHSKAMLSDNQFDFFCIQIHMTADESLGMLVHNGFLCIDDFVHSKYIA